MARILVLNAGSATLKARLFDVTVGEPRALAGLHAGGIGSGTVRYTPSGGDAWVADDAGVAGAVRETLRWLEHEHGGLATVDAVGHRIVHGGDLSEATAVDDALIDYLRGLEAMAPLHNRPALTAMDAVRSLTSVPMVAVFDNAFHSTLPPEAATYAIPADLAQRHGIRRYGFHGTAHRWLALRAANLMGAPLESLRLITLQLGSGCSACAIAGGRSVDTSMGLSPLEGLVMRTRSGDIDPAIVSYLARREGVTAETVVDWLNTRSGLAGLAGRSGMMQEIVRGAAEGDPACDLALSVFCYRVKKYIGAYLAALGGADAVVFGGGIGENSAEVRARICAGMEWCGIEIDEARNRAVAGGAARITRDDAGIRVWVVNVDEETLIAKDTAVLLGLSG